MKKIVIAPAVVGLMTLLSRQTASTQARQASMIW